MELYPKIEYATREEISQFQDAKLRELLIYLREKSPFYQKVFAENHIDISTINSTKDLARLPFTTKNDLQQNNQEFFCVPLSDISDFSTTSGTLGDPVTFGLSDKDLERLAYNEAISFACAGIQKGDIVQMMTTIDKRFMAGMAYFIGLHKLGAGIVRMGP